VPFDFAKSVSAFLVLAAKVVICFLQIQPLMQLLNYGGKIVPQIILEAVNFDSAKIMSESWFKKGSL